MKKNQSNNKGNIKDTEAGQEAREQGNGNKNLPEVPGQAEKKESPTPEGQVAETLPALQNIILDREPYVGTDGTTVVEVTHIYVQEEKKDPRVEEAKAWFDLLARGKFDAARQIEVGIEIARSVSDDYNEFYNYTQMSLAGRQILLGKVCLNLKGLTRKAGFMWQKWATTHLPFLKPRSRERAMLLAERKDCHPYLPLGTERLELLVQATRGSKEKDPIGSLLRKYNILYTQDSDVSPTDFKALIDAVLNAEKFSQNQISVDFELVKRLTSSGVEVNNSLVKRLQENKKLGGSETRYLEHLVVSGRKALSDLDPERPVLDFNSLSSRMLNALAQVLEDETHLGKIDTKVLSELITELQSLQTKLPPTTETQAA